MEFTKQTGLSVIVCYYPPNCSKWNPIERRLFSQVHKAMEGVVFSDYQTVKKLIEQTSTKTGLTVVVRLNLKEYQTGIKIDKKDMDEKKLHFTLLFRNLITEFIHRFVQIILNILLSYDLYYIILEISCMVHIF